MKIKYRFIKWLGTIIGNSWFRIWLFFYGKKAIKKMLIESLEVEDSFFVRNVVGNLYSQYMKERGNHK